MAVLNTYTKKINYPNPRPLFRIYSELYNQFHIQRLSFS